MAVYTTLTRTEIETFLASYDVGELIDFNGVEQGVENTNYIITTNRARFILTIFEQRTNRDDLPFFFAFMAHLKKDGIDCPFIIDDRIGEIKGKAAVLISFLSGSNIAPEMITPALCFEMGQLLGRMHNASENFTQTRENSMGISAWKGLFAKIELKLDGHFPGLKNPMQEELAVAGTLSTLSLPRGVVHADAFPDNVFMTDGHVTGIIDFYFSATDYYLYDVCITMNAWCFENGIADQSRMDAMLNGYESVRKLSGDEKGAMNICARAAALRILMTRTHDFIFHDPSALVRPKDPMEYAMILEHYRNDRSNG